MKRLIILMTFLVLVGALVLSRPLVAGKLPVKATVDNVVKNNAARSTVKQSQISSLRAAIVQSIRFQLSRWLGTPIVIVPTHIPPVVDDQSPDRSGGHGHDIVITKDHGGEEVAN